MADSVIYFDNAATTAVDKRVLEAMLPYLQENYGNPSAKYSLGYAARNLINETREAVAELIGAEPEEIYFTAGGTEADNIALESGMSAEGKRHMIVSAIEHPAVINKAEQLKKRGFEVSYVKPDRYGFISVGEVEKLIRPDTGLISIMLANNELGTVEPVSEIAEMAHRQGVLFHTDAVQAFGQLPVCVKDMNIDYLSASAHKIYGPKGIGVLYAGRKAPLCPVEFGGGQEYGVRPGTENVAAIAGLKCAVELALAEMQEREERERKICAYIAERLLKEVPDSLLNGPQGIICSQKMPENSDAAEAGLHDAFEGKYLPGILNFSFKGIRGASLALRLDMEKICVSTGSACAAGNEKSSHVLEAVGLGRDWIDGSLRISVGKYNTLEEAEMAADRIIQLVEELRELNSVH